MKITNEEFKKFLEIAMELDEKTEFTWILLIGLLDIDKEVERGNPH